MAIIVKYIHPPIPTRRFDWCAYVEGHEEIGPYGWGKTAGEAKIDLYAQTHKEET